MNLKSFIITVDTEGDNLWNWTEGKAITAENANYIERFQSLCEKFGYKPVYLLNHEMVQSKVLKKLLFHKMQKENAESVCTFMHGTALPLVCADAIYLNEVNFRHSGNGYALIKNKIPAPYIFCRDMMGEDITEYNSFVESDSCHMDEINELTHLKENGVSVIELFRSILKTKTFAVFSVTDRFGSYLFYKPYINSMKNKIRTRFSRRTKTTAEANHVGNSNSKNRGGK